MRRKTVAPILGNICRISSSKSFWSSKFCRRNRIQNSNLGGRHRLIAEAEAAAAASLGGGDDEDWWTVIRRYMTDPEFRQRARVT